MIILHWYEWNGEQQFAEYEDNDEENAKCLAYVMRKKGQEFRAYQIEITFGSKLSIDRFKEITHSI